MTDILTRIASVAGVIETVKDVELPEEHLQRYSQSSLARLIGLGRCREKHLLDLAQEAAGEIEGIRKAAQNVIDTFKIGDGIVKDGVPRYVAHAIATTALHQLNQALKPQESANG